MPFRRGTQLNAPGEVFSTEVSNATANVPGELFSFPAFFQEKSDTSIPTPRRHPLLAYKATSIPVLFTSTKQRRSGWDEFKVMMDQEYDDQMATATMKLS
jgi:hypothetical protein